MLSTGSDWDASTRFCEGKPGKGIYTLLMFWEGGVYFSIILQKFPCKRDWFLNDLKSSVSRFLSAEDFL